MKAIVKQLDKALLCAKNKNRQNEYKQLMKKAIEMYDQKQDACDRIFRRLNPAENAMTVLNLTGLKQEEAEQIIQAYLEGIKGDLDSKKIVPNTGDENHHVVRVIWGSQAIISGLNRIKVVSNYSVSVKLHGDMMYIVLKRD